MSLNGFTVVDSGSTVPINTEGFDLIISDVMMPRLTGIALLAKINETDRTQGDKLVFLTASVLPSEIEATFRGLPTVVLRKPIGIAALRGFVKGRF